MASGVFCVPLGAPLRLASRFPSRRGQRRLVLVPVKTHFISNHCEQFTLYLHRDDLFSRRMRHFGTASTGFWHGYCKTEKEHPTFAWEENAAFTTGFLCQICRFLNSTMLCPLLIQRLTFDGFHLLRVLGIFWLSYITSPDPQCPVRVE